MKVFVILTVLSISLLGASAALADTPGHGGTGRRTGSSFAQTEGRGQGGSGRSALQAREAGQGGSGFEFIGGEGI